MKSYEEIKIWLKDKENKQKIVLGVCFILVFFVGFGAGGYEREIRRDIYKSQTNYTTQQTKKPVSAAAGANTNQATAAVAGTSTAAANAQAANCPVKGNISSTGGKIYHVPGGAFYKTVKPEQCFNTESEAQAAGFRKSGR